MTTSPKSRASWWRLLPLLLMLAGGCEVVRDHLYSPKIEVKCEVLRKMCHFRNFGDPGEDCVMVEVFHMASGRVMRSRVVCSGHIERDTPTTVAVEFDDADPLLVCMGENMEQNFVKQCKVTVVEVEKWYVPKKP